MTLRRGRKEAPVFPRHILATLFIAVFVAAIVAMAMDASVAAVIAGRKVG